MVTNIGIQAAAAAVVEARTALEEASARVAKAEQERAPVLERVNALAAERASILAERAADRPSADHGARLATNSADTEILAEVLARREGEVAAMKSAENARRMDLTVAEQVLKQVTATEHRQRLIAHANQLTSLLAATIREIAIVTETLGEKRVAWAPSVKFMDEIRLLDIRRREAIAERGGAA
jgi:hypothetical protein